MPPVGRISKVARGAGARRAHSRGRQRGASSPSNLQYRRSEGSSLPTPLRDRPPHGTGTGNDQLQPADAVDNDDLNAMSTLTNVGYHQNDCPINVGTALDNPFIDTSMMLDLAQQHQRHMAQTLPTASQAAQLAYGHDIRNDSALCKKLAPEPAHREPIQRREGQHLNMDRRSNVEALMAHLTGTEVEQPCKNCRKGHGPWTKCVVLQGQICGSCSNCWFNASGSRCSFHENNNILPQTIYHTGTSITPTSAVGVDQLALSSPDITVMQQHRVCENPDNNATAGIVMSSSPGWAAQHGHGIGGRGTDRYSTIDCHSRHIINQAVGDSLTFSKRQRFVVRIQHAAKELGMLISEYDEWLCTPEGMAEQKRIEEEELRRETYMEEDRNSECGRETETGRRLQKLTSVDMAPVAVMDGVRHSESPRASAI